MHPRPRRGKGVEREGEPELGGEGRDPEQGERAAPGQVGRRGAAARGQGGGAEAEAVARGEHRGVQRPPRGLGEGPEATAVRAWISLNGTNAS